YYDIPERDRLTKYDIEQGTITVSNLGSLYKDWDGICALLEIIPPQVAAIGVGAPRDMAIANPDGTVTVGKKLVFTVVLDHRALEKGDVVPILKSIDETFKHPEVIKEWV
ncbi:MAG: 2-oxo acid dehydrogenase subunit E2, partial [Oscillospiraceae bacterium]|nr:2-oxo acid dehydrogenase subunit E2 [Oscillospiraceae bacterium]